MKSLWTFSVLILTACSSLPAPDESTYGASVGIVNHTGNYIYSASVNGAGGANMSRWGAGMADVCCATVPSKWYPGMRVLVQWDMPEGSKHNLKEKYVEVEKYDEPGSIYMHFFPDDNVRVVVSRAGGASPMHPIAPPQKPNASQKAQ